MARGRPGVMMLSIVVLLGGIGMASPSHGSFRDNPFMRPPASCGTGLNSTCDAPNREKTLPPRAPVRECPADSSVTTRETGQRYCLPDRILKLNYRKNLSLPRSGASCGEAQAIAKKRISEQPKLG
jgi:hypothetical protein